MRRPGIEPGTCEADFAALSDVFPSAFIKNRATRGGETVREEPRGALSIELQRRDSRRRESNPQPPQDDDVVPPAFALTQAAHAATTLKEFRTLPTELRKRSPSPGVEPGTYECSFAFATRPAQQRARQGLGKKGVEPRQPCGCHNQNVIFPAFVLDRATSTRQEWTGHSARLVPPDERHAR